MNRLLSRLYLGLVYLFLFLPLVVIVLFAFHQGDDPTRWPPRLITLHWFDVMFHDEDILSALQNSLIVGLIAVMIAAILGILAALGMYHYRFRFAPVFYAASMLPAFVPGLVLGVSLLLLFSALHIGLSLVTIIIGHITFLTPVILTNILSRLERLPPSYEQASRDLGATQTQTFFLVILPNIRTALISSLLYAFMLSFDNIVLTFFLTGFQKTLPLEFWGRIRFGLNPATNAVATLLLLFSVILLMGSNWIMREEKS
jgi:spermidine/putrescine transport system permease protein